jgi:O-antigen/teichoic acid export membrane protein
MADTALVLLLVLLLVRDGGSPLILVAWIEVGGRSMLAAYCWLSLRRHATGRTPEPAPESSKHLLGEGLPVAISELCRVVHSHGGILMLGALASATQAGFFLVSHKIVLTLALLPGLVQMAVFPLTSRLSIGSSRGALALQGRVLIVLLVPMMLLAASGAVFAEPALTLLFGAGFEDAAPVLRVAVWTLPAAAVTACARSLLIAGHSAPRLLSGVGLGAAANIASMLLLVPEYGAVGAATACVIGEVTTAIALGIAVATLESS